MGVPLVRRRADRRMKNAVATETVFRARGLAKTYRTGEMEVRALRDVDLDIARGEFVVLLEPSGSGKSTLLNILGGLDVASAGKVVFGDQDLSAATGSELTAYRRRHVGFVFQFYNLIPRAVGPPGLRLVDQAGNGPPVEDGRAEGPGHRGGGTPHRRP